MRPVYFLGIFIPLAVGLDIAGASPVLDLLRRRARRDPHRRRDGRVDRAPGRPLGPGIGGLLNVTFGNAPELIIAFFALEKGLQEVVKASIAGSILGNVLLVLGAAMLVGGWKREKQTFNATAAMAQSGMLLLALLALILPAVFELINGGGLPPVGEEGPGFAKGCAGIGAENCGDLKTMSFLVAIILMLTYVGGLTEFDWRVGTHILDAALEFAPSSRLLLRPGIRLMKRDVTLLIDGVADPTASKRSKRSRPRPVSFRPADIFTLRGDLQSITNGTPYTRISPRTNVSSRIIARLAPVERVVIEDNVNVRNAEFETTDFRNTVRSNATSVSYTLTNKAALRGGFTYDSFLATASVTFLRGVAPLAAVWRYQTINRVWTAGIDARPVAKFPITLSGNYVRTTGVGEISGELPAFGPLRWPLVTGTVSYDFPRAGTLSIDLQRTYYIEEIMHGDNFSANILGIRWTKEF